MNSVPIILQSPSEIIIKGNDRAADALNLIKNARYDVRMSSQQDSELQDALAYYINDADPTVVALATNLSRPGKTPNEYTMLRNMLYSRLVDGSTLTQFQANVCIFNHDKSIDVSLRNYGIERSTPQLRGASMFRGLCHYCSTILSGTCTPKGCKLFFNDVAKAGSSFFPSIDSQYNASNGTGYADRLLNVFKRIVSEPVSQSEPAALIFVFQSVAYFDYMNDQAQTSTIANFAQTSSTRDILAIEQINNIFTILTTGRFNKSIDGQYITPQLIFRGQELETSTSPNIASNGIVIRDIDGNALILQGEKQFLPTSKKLLNSCNIK